MKSKLFLLSMLVVLVAACGGRKGGTDDPLGDGGSNTGGDSDDPVFCTSGDQCRSGVCEGGQCVDASTCQDHGECPAAQYCHFPSAPIPWVSGTTGNCEGPCTNENSCGIVGQECHAYPPGGARRCYTNIDCNPANNSSDCPPGEVCWQDSRTCKWPPPTCYFAEQCPLTAEGTRWVCDPATGECIDPTAVGDCNIDSDCDDRPGCSTGCTCRDGVCEIAGSCDPTPAGDTACGTGNYCAGGVCQPATPCGPPDEDGHNQCLPYSLVCRGGYCGNPEPCAQPGNTCTGGWECNTNFNPPVCFPPGMAGCTRHDQCASDMYCDNLDGQCKIGCRDNSSCIGQCGGATATCIDGTTPCPNGDTDCPGGLPGSCASGGNECYCQNNHTCDTEVVTAGDCDSDAECPGGTKCAPADPMGALLCDPKLGGIGGPGCEASCRQTCDLLTSAILDPCPAGEKCGGDGGFIETLIATFFASIFTNDSGAVCLPVSP